MRKDTKENLETLKKLVADLSTIVNTVKTPQPLAGWVCPKCGAGLSPFISVCPCTTIPYTSPNTSPWRPYDVWYCNSCRTTN